jgi:DNA mismatch endonuclease, patch repair protein
MVDVVSTAVRSRMMSGIRSKNTKPEMALRQGLHALGFRFRLHDKRLPGTPDIVLPRYRAAIFVHGCFWHGHGCSLFKWPSTRVDFWRSKILRNKRLDDAAGAALLEAGWRCGVVWECALRGSRKLGLPVVLEESSRWIISNDLQLTLCERSS